MKEDVIPYRGAEAYKAEQRALGVVRDEMRLDDGIDPRTRLTALYVIVRCIMLKNGVAADSLLELDRRALEMQEHMQFEMMPMPKIDPPPDAN